MQTETDYRNWTVFINDFYGIEFQALHVLPDILESSCSATENARIWGAATVVIKYRMWILQAQCQIQEF